MACLRLQVIAFAVLLKALSFGSQLLHEIGRGGGKSDATNH
jgi:hypothetical protein